VVRWLLSLELVENVFLFLSQRDSVGKLTSNCYLAAIALEDYIHRRTGRHFTEGRKKFALKITICPKNKQFALKLTFLVNPNGA